MVKVTAQEALLQKCGIQPGFTHRLSPPQAFTRQWSLAKSSKIRCFWGDSAHFLALTGVGSPVGGDDQYLGIFFSLKGSSLFLSTEDLA